MRGLEHMKVDICGVGLSSKTIKINVNCLLTKRDNEEKLYVPTAKAGVVFPSPQSTDSNGFIYDFIQASKFRALETLR